VSKMCSVHEETCCWEALAQYALCGGPLVAADDGAAAVQAERVQRAVGRLAVEQQRIAPPRLYRHALLPACRVAGIAHMLQ
jgi:hypothetical protein